MKVGIPWMTFRNRVSAEATRQCLSWHFPSMCEPLLRARRERPRRRAAEQRYERAPLHV
jgi:hypothetical protein